MCFRVQAPYHLQASLFLQQKHESRKEDPEINDAGRWQGGGRMGGWWEYQQNAALVGGVRFSRGSAAQSTLVTGGCLGRVSIPAEGPREGSGVQGWEHSVPRATSVHCLRLPQLTAGPVPWEGNAEWRSETRALARCGTWG